MSAQQARVRSHGRSQDRERSRRVGALLAPDPQAMQWRVFWQRGGQTRRLAVNAEEEPPDGVGWG